jgi:hypothetical protein
MSKKNPWEMTSTRKTVSNVFDDSLSAAADLGIELPQSETHAKADDVLKFVDQFQSLCTLQVEVQKYNAHANLRHVTDAQVLHTRLKKLKLASNTLNRISSNVHATVNTLKMAESDQSISVEVEYQAVFKRLLEDLAVEQKNVAEFDTTLAWTMDFKEPPTCWEQALSPLATTLSTIREYKAVLVEMSRLRGIERHISA